MIKAFLFFFCHLLQIYTLVSIFILCFYPPEPVVAFALEPQGSKLAVIHGEPPLRIQTTFYQINDKGGKPTILRKILAHQTTYFIVWLTKKQTS